SEKGPEGPDRRPTDDRPRAAPSAAGSCRRLVRLGLARLAALDAALGFHRQRGLLAERRRQPERLHELGAQPLVGNVASCLPARDAGSRGTDPLAQLDGADLLRVTRRLNGGAELGIALRLHHLPVHQEGSIGAMLLVAGSLRLISPPARRRLQGL